MSYKRKIQRYARPLKNSLEPKHRSTPTNSQLQLICYIGKSIPNSSSVLWDALL